MPDRNSFRAVVRCVFLLVAWALPLAAQTWTLHGPQSRHSHTAVYDPTTKNMIIFGGQATATNADLNDVWLGQTSTNQNDSFQQLLPSGSAPAARYGHVATYDSSTNRMTIFGGGEGNPGNCEDDVWILENANGQGAASWIQPATSGTAPPKRLYSAGAWDSNTNTLMLFGGNNCGTTYYDDVWTLTNANGEGGTSAWKKLKPTGTAPAARESASVVYDSENNILIVFGGESGSKTSYKDVWILTHANGQGGTAAWTELAPTGTGPVARTGQTATYDQTNSRMTIFGGNANGTTLTDSWVLTGANGQSGTPAWVQLATQGTAPSLAYHSAVYDAADDLMYVFAGSSTADKLQVNDHAFTLTDANGLESGAKWYLGGPPVRYGHSAFYDAVSNGLFIFGGQHSSTNLDFADYWEAYDVIGSSNLKWTTVTSNGSKPSARFGHTGLYDSGSNHFMVFGGATGYPAPCVNDYHVLTNANNTGGGPVWSAVTPSGAAPAARYRQASVYVASTNQIVLFGGNNCSTTYYNDVWILSNANNSGAKPAWAELTVTGSQPSARQSASAVYDPTTNALIVYGGDAGGAPDGDIWILSHADGSGGTSEWTELTPANSGPVARSGHTATYDSVHNIMTIYGGFSGTAVLNDAWVLSNANGTGGKAEWTQLAANQPRRFHTSDYDASTNELITFGGQTNVQPLDPVSDIYTLTEANGQP